MRSSKSREPNSSRPMSAVGLPPRFRKEESWKPNGEGACNPPAALSTTRLPSLSGAGPHLSRQPARLWAAAESPGGQRAVIGQGAFGCVFRATFKDRPAAVKEVGSRPNCQCRWPARAGDSPDHHYRREVRGADFLLDLRHENVVRYLHFDTGTPGVLYVVMELIEGCNLTELRRAGPLTQGLMRSVLEQASRGLNYLHSQRVPILHRDVKGSNIMLTDLGHLVKLVDLGLAIVWDDDCDKDLNGNDKDCQTTRRSLAGTHRFMAPEVYERHAYSPKSDVFALGCSAFELLSGRPPHADKTNDMAVCYAVMNSPMPDVPGGCDQRLADLYRWCTRRDPAMRPTTSQILQHSFIVGGSA